MLTGAEVLTDKIIQLPARLPAEVERSARLHFLDALGVGLAAAKMSPARHIARGFNAVPSGGCTVLGSRQKFSPTDAALINGTLIHSVEFDDTHTASVMHGSSVLMPVVLAAAQAAGADGLTMLGAFAAGWETLIRIGLAAPSGFQKVGFQGTSVGGTVAGAVSVARVKQFDRDLLRNAIGLAPSFSSGNFTYLAEGATGKAAQAGIAASGALTAAQLAEGGLTASTAVFEGDGGFFGIFARDASAADRFRSLAETIGSHWLITDAAFKEYPCCHFIHPFIEAVRNLSTNPSSADDIEQIRCRVPAGQENIIVHPWETKQSPIRASDARWSLPYVVALQAATGRVGMADFVGEPAPAALALAKRVTWEPWPESGYPQRFPAAVEIVFRDGTRKSHTLDDVNGNWTRPWGRPDVVEKFTANAELAGLSTAQREEIVRAFLDDENPSLAVLQNLP